MRRGNQTETAGIVPNRVAMPGVRKPVVKGSGNAQTTRTHTQSYGNYATIVYLGEPLQRLDATFIIVAYVIDPS